MVPFNTCLPPSHNTIVAAIPAMTCMSGQKIPQSVASHMFFCR